MKILRLCNSNKKVIEGNYTLGTIYGLAVRVIMLTAITMFMIFSFSSCRAPFACFVLSENEDSIPVHTMVYFNAICSDNASEFFWSFPNDSVAYGIEVAYTFRDTGQFIVRLIAAGNGKSRHMQKTLTVIQP